MEQLTLYHEDINDALRSAVKAIGGTKSVATKLWPEKTIQEAHSYLNDCLNPARPAKLSPEQVLLLLRWAREAGFHGAMAFVCGESGYSVPSPVSPSDEAAEVQRQFIDAVKTVQRLGERWERIAQAPMTAINGGRQG